MTSRELGYKLAFLPRCALHHPSLRAASRHRPIARDRRGSLLGRSSVNNLGWLAVAGTRDAELSHPRLKSGPL